MIKMNRILEFTLKFGFRLLNSEIGNDPQRNAQKAQSFVGFRLLNSEIGNDQDYMKRKRKLIPLFSSP